MNLHFNKSKASSYVSISQIARVLSEPLLVGITNPALSRLFYNIRIVNPNEQNKSKIRGFQTPRQLGLFIANEQSPEYGNDLFL